MAAPDATKFLPDPSSLNKVACFVFSQASHLHTSKLYQGLSGSDRLPFPEEKEQSGKGEEQNQDINGLQTENRTSAHYL